MSTDSSLLDYHKSISKELESVQSRVRQLIGDKHWASDGEYRETVLRKVLQDHLPETVKVGRGFIFYEKGELSHQIDILLIDRSRPILFGNGDLAIVTPDTVRAVIEVKAAVHTISGFKSIAQKLADDAQKLREEVSSPERRTWVGLFAFESRLCHSSAPRLLEALQQVTSTNPKRIINSVSLGTDGFIRYIFKEDEREGRLPDGWIYYRLERLSSAYFISHTVWSTVDRDLKAGKYAWFPIDGAATKYGCWRIDWLETKATPLLHPSDP